MSRRIATKEDKKMFREMFLTSLPLESSYNFEKQQALGFLIAMSPAIKRFYHTKEEQSEAMLRHMAIFNTNPQLVSTITGITAVLEKEASENSEFDKTTINAIKIGLMGPVAGIGDSFFWGTLRVIAAGIGISLAAEGSILGPVIFLLIFNIPHYLARYFGLKYGYLLGTDLLFGAKSNGLLAKITKSACTVGLIVIGAMTSTLVKMTTPIKFVVGEAEFLLQDCFDQIFPLALPLLFTYICYILIKKGMKPTTLLLLTIGFGILGKYIGIF